MKRVEVCQARDGGSPVVPVVIEVSGELPEIPRNTPNYLDEHTRMFLAEATKIEKALYDALPGGTYDQLVGLFLKRKSSHFIVSHSS